MRAPLKARIGTPQSLSNRGAGGVSLVGFSCALEVAQEGLSRGDPEGRMTPLGPPCGRTPHTLYEDMRDHVRLRRGKLNVPHLSRLCPQRLW